MKKLFLALLSILFVTVLFAHPPKSVKVNYNKEKGELTIEADHKVRNVETHFIDVITVYINDIEKEKISLIKQSSLEAEKHVYKIGALKTGDVVKVTAGCNKFGSRSAEITIK